MPRSHFRMDRLSTHETTIAAALMPVESRRYANRAKNIKNKPKINEDPKDAMLRQYKVLYVVQSVREVDVDQRSNYLGYDIRCGRRGARSIDKSILMAFRMAGEYRSNLSTMWRQGKEARANNGSRLKEARGSEVIEATS